MRIYTRRGDDGSTSLYGGRSVSKADRRVEAYGRLDETNAVVGWVRAAAPPSEIDAALADVQGLCFRAGAWLACAPGADPGVEAPSATDVEALEQAIDELEDALPALETFILPGGCEVGARLHVARTVARGAERAATALAAAEEVPEFVLPWLNRLSDFLFVAARVANRRADVTEEAWPPRTR